MNPDHRVSGPLCAPCLLWCPLLLFASASVEGSVCMLLRASHGALLTLFVCLFSCLLVCLFALLCFQAENARLRYPEAEAEAPTAVKKPRKSLLRRAIRKTYKTIKRIGTSSSKRSSSTITTDNSAAGANTTVGSAVTHVATRTAERDDSARFTTMRPVEPAESTFTFVDVE